MKNYQAILLSVLGGGISYGMASTHIQTMMPFNTILSEIVVFVLGGVMCISGLLSINYIKLLKSLD